MESDGGPCCFVCAGSDPPLLRVCDCTTVIHARCLRELIARVPSHASRCAVCHKDYRVPYKTKLIVRWDNVIKIATVLSSILIALSWAVWATRDLPLRESLVAWAAILFLECMIAWFTSLMIAARTVDFFFFCMRRVPAVHEALPMRLTVVRV